MAISLAAVLAGCAGSGKPGQGSAVRADSTLFHIPGPGAGAQPRFFREYRSRTGWNFAAVNPEWVEVPAERTERGYPVRTLVRKEDRKLRISFFETTLPVEIWNLLRSGLNPKTNAIGSLVFLASIALLLVLEIGLFGRSRKS